MKNNNAEREKFPIWDSFNVGKFSQRFFAKTTCHWLDGKVMLTKETCEMILQSSTGSSRKLLKLNCKTKIILQGKRDTSNGDVSASSAAKAKRMTRIAPPLPPQQTKLRKRRCHRLSKESQIQNSTSGENTGLDLRINCKFQIEFATFAQL
jgi:hypothetical protein